MDKREIVKKIHDFVIQRIDSVGGAFHQTEYKKDFLRIFKSAHDSDIRLYSDAILDAVSERWPVDVSRSEYNSMILDVMRSWDEWMFFEIHYGSL